MKGSDSDVRLTFLSVSSLIIVPLFLYNGVSPESTPETMKIRLGNYHRHWSSLDLLF